MVTQPFGREVVPDVYMINARCDNGGELANCGKVGDLSRFVDFDDGSNLSSGTSWALLRRPASRPWKEGWMMIKEGSESEIV